MTRIAKVLLISFIAFGTLFAGIRYTEYQGKAYLLETDDLRVITNEGSRKLPLFGIPVTILEGTRPYVLTSEALFAVDHAGEKITTAFRLDRAYSAAVIGPNDRIYLLSADALSVVQGSATGMSMLYTFALPRLSGGMFKLASGNLLFVPSSGQTAFTFDPNTKQVSDLKLPWTANRPVMTAGILVNRSSSGLAFFNLSTRQSSAVDLGAEPSRIHPWKGKILASAGNELVLVDASSSSILSRVSIPGLKALSSIETENFATVLSGENLLTVTLPSLAVTDTFNAGCQSSSASYPFFGKPLFVCGNKLALPGSSETSQHYFVQSVQETADKAYSLQVGAFSDPMSFGPLMEALARQGLPYYYIEEGGLTKFRVGFFKTRQEADRVRSFMQDYDSWVVTENQIHTLYHSIHDMNGDVRPDAAVAKGDSVLILSLYERTWIEVLKASQLSETIEDIYFHGKNQVYVKLAQSGLRELVLPDSGQ